MVFKRLVDIILQMCVQMKIRIFGNRYDDKAVSKVDKSMTKTRDERSVYMAFYVLQRGDNTSDGEKDDTLTYNFNNSRVILYF